MHATHHLDRRNRTQQAREIFSDAGRLLAASTDFEQMLAGVAELAVRSLADFCVIDVLEEEGLRRLQAVHADPDYADLTRELLKFPPDPRRPHPSLQALGTGRPVLVPELSDSFLEAATQEAEHRLIFEALRPRSLIAVPLVARDRVLGVILIVSTDRSYDEDDLALAEKLAQFAALELDNARLYRESQRALLARDHVLGIVAHDLRSPLNAIITGAQLLLDDSLPELQRGHQAQMIVRAGTRMNRLIQDLLDVARIEANQLVLHRVIQEPAGLVREAVDLHGVQTAAKSVSLSLDVEDELPSISADQDRLLQVLSNLIGNATKFTPEGGRIAVAVKRSDEGVCFTVSDTGPGIPDESLPRLFQPFWQAQPGSLDGAGLGLTIARGIVEAHGGRIWVESILGHGSSFHFTVPSVSSRPQGERRLGPAERRAAAA